MHYRHYITISSVRVEVFPLNWMQCSLVDELEKERIFYRRKFSGVLTFSADDFDLFFIAETINPCEDLIYEIEQKDSGADTYHEYWTGHFSTTDGNFDLDRCLFQITPKPYDNYYNFDLYGEAPVDIFDATPVVTTNTVNQAYDRNRWLIDVIELLVEEIYSGATVTSWFLNNSENPVIMGPNQYRYLTIAQKSDIKRPNSSNPATIALLSFNELMHMLKMFNLWWTFDGTTVRIEHYDYWQGLEGVDLRTQKISEKQNKYNYKKEDMPYYENFQFMEAEDTNYYKHWISYEDPCVNRALSFEYLIRVTTDLSYIEKCVEDSEGLGLISNISDEGFVILANFLFDGDYHVYYGTSYNNEVASYNFPCSWSYLLRAFHLHGRILLDGYINGSVISFISTIKTKIQQIKAIICFEDNYEPNQYITTELGEDWFGGEKGYVQAATIKPSGQVDFTLGYGPDKDTEVVMPTRPKSLHCEIDEGGGTVTSTLSEPNIYDTFYWIWWNEDTCQEIEIPAGELRQVDSIDEVDPITDIKFNVLDPSLDFWNFIYNDNETWAECSDLDCGGGVPPPAIPSAPTLNSVNQGSPCGPIEVSWSAVAGATYYQIWRKPDGEMFDDYGWIDVSYTNSHDDYEAGVTDLTEFFYKIKACNISGCSGFSNALSEVSDCTE